MLSSQLTRGLLKDLLMVFSSPDFEACLPGIPLLLGLAEGTPGWWGRTMAQARGLSSVLHCIPLSGDTEGMVSTIPRDLPEAAGAKRSNGAEYQETLCDVVRA